MQWNCWNGREKKLWQLICGNGNVEMQGKKMWQLICGNGIAEIEGKKHGAIDLWQCCCRHGEKKKIVAIELPKIGERELSG